MKNTSITAPMAILLLALPAFLSATPQDFLPAASIEDVPPALRSDWRRGDWTIVTGSMQILIAGPRRSPEWRKAVNAPHAPGSILVCVPPGSETGNELNIGPPLLRLGGIYHYPTYHLAVLRSTGRGEGPFLEFQAAFSGPGGEKAEIRTVYTLLPEGTGLRLNSTITNTGKNDIEELHYALDVVPGTRYSFSPFDRKKLNRLPYRLYHKRDHSLAWVSLHPPPSKDSPVPGNLAPGKSYTVDHALLVDREGESLLRRVLELLRVPSYRTKIAVPEPKNRLIEFVVKDFLTSGVVYRDFLKDTPLLFLNLPEGSYVATANIFPAVVESRFRVSAAEENVCLLEDPPQGTATVKIEDDDGRFLPGKVTFLGLDPTRSPYFEPDNPRQTERGWETDKNSCYPPQEGQTIDLPVGVYLACASHGPEFTAEQKIVEVLEGSRQVITFRLKRALETPDLLSLDPHLHTTFSDGSSNLADRVKSIVAEGLEAAVSTDHNFIVDYHPTLKDLGLDRYLSVVSGVEVTANRSGIHFNTYPVALKSGEENNGAPPFRQERADSLFRGARGKYPEALLQLNHPRAGNLGYFNSVSLDQESAAWASDKASLDFDLMEVMNGPFYHSSNSRVIEDWFHLLNRGRFAPLVGSSDSHGTDREEPGYSRTYLLLGSRKDSGWTWSAVWQALRKGRSFTSNGPLLEMRVNETSTFGDTVQAGGGAVDIAFAVRGAPWVDIDEVRLIVNGERRIVFPVRTSDGQATKIAERIRLELNRDSYLALEAVGRRSLYPVVQRPSLSGQPQDAPLPYALSNPVFVDVDGNGAFDPPWPEDVEFVKDIPVKQRVVTRY